MYKQLDLAGKVAVVVGGSSGIGKVLALGLAKGGADVVSSARRKDWSTNSRARLKLSASARSALPATSLIVVH